MVQLRALGQEEDQDKKMDQQYTKQGWKKPRFLRKFLGFGLFLDFSVQIRLDTKFPPRINILYTIHSLSEHFCKI